MNRRSSNSNSVNTKSLSSRAMQAVFGKDSGSRRRRRTTRARLSQIETLETRQLLAADFAAVYGPVQEVNLPLFGGIETAALYSQHNKMQPVGDARVSQELRDVYDSLSEEVVVSAEAGENLRALVVQRSESVGPEIHVTLSKVRDVTGVQDALEGIGFEATGDSPEHHYLEGFLPVNSIPLIEDVAIQFDVGIRPSPKPLTDVGEIEGQMTRVLESQRVLASEIRDADGDLIDGSGVTIGVISSSFDKLGSETSNPRIDVLAGDLPGIGNPNGYTTPVQVVQENIVSASDNDEGRAMMQLIHDIAPGASLAFAAGGIQGQQTYANLIKQLANPFGTTRADIIVDDVPRRDEPFFQDGLIAQAVSLVSEVADVAYLAAAGNRNTQAWESADFQTISTGIPFLNRLVDFDNSTGVDITQHISVEAGRELDLTLQWDDPWFTTSGVDTDLDIFLYPSNASGELIADTVFDFEVISQDDNIATQDPIERLYYKNNTNVIDGEIVAGAGETEYFVLVLKIAAGPDPERIKWVDYSKGTQTGILEYATEQTNTSVTPHASAPGAMAVGAANYFQQDRLASSSSYGVQTILFDYEGNRLETPVVRDGVDFVAIHGSETSFFGGSDVEDNGVTNFFGTSAAAPVAAGVAALVLQANPDFSPTQLETRLKSTATDMEGAGFDVRTGAGLINAWDAVFGTEVVSAAIPGDGLSEDFEDGYLNGSWQTEATGAGNVLTSNAAFLNNSDISFDDIVAESGDAQLVLGGTADNIGSRWGGPYDYVSRAIWNVDTTDQENVVLSFSARILNDDGDNDSNPAPEAFLPSDDFDAVYLELAGEDELIRLIDTDVLTEEYQDFSVDLTQVAADGGFHLGDAIRIGFQSTGADGLRDDALLIDNVLLTSDYLPSVMVDNPTIVGGPKDLLTNGGAFADGDGNETVTLSASIGEVTSSVDGTWAWSLQASRDGVPTTDVLITATDTEGNVATVAFTYEVRTPQSVSGELVALIGQWQDDEKIRFITESMLKSRIRAANMFYEFGLTNVALTQMDIIQMQIERESARSESLTDEDVAEASLLVEEMKQLMEDYPTNPFDN